MYSRNKSKQINFFCAIDFRPAHTTMTVAFFAPRRPKLTGFPTFPLLISSLRLFPLWLLVSGCGCRQQIVVTTKLGLSERQRPRLPLSLCSSARGTSSSSVEIWRTSQVKQIVDEHTHTHSRSVHVCADKWLHIHTQSIHTADFGSDMRLKLELQTLSVHHKFTSPLSCQVREGGGRFEHLL